MKLLILFTFCFSLISCNGQINKTEKQTDSSSIQRLTSNQISNVVRTVFQDTKGRFWFGGEGGAYSLEGDVLNHYNKITSEEGKGITIKDIIEDVNGKIWFGHTDGLSVFDGTTIRNYYESDGLISNDVWSIAADKNGKIWIGTIDGVCTFDGIEFVPFDIPEGKKNPNRGVSSKKIVHDIIEDSKGRIWFSTNGGVYVKDKNSLINISIKDGLNTNFINKITEDKDGTFWIAASDALYHYSDSKITNVTEDFITDGKGIATVIQDSDGDIWFVSDLRDIYSYDGKKFKKYQISEDYNAPASFHVYEDNQRRLWFVGYGGAYRMENDKFINVRQDGPW